MSDEVEATTTETVKKLSDGKVSLTIEKYEEMVEKINAKDGTITSLREQLRRLREEPPVINRTIVHKTVEMQLQDHRVWGGTFMTVGAGLFVIGALRYKAGTKS